MPFLKHILSYRFIVSIFLFVTILNKAQSQDVELEFEHKVSGTIVDETSGETIPFAPVMLYSNDSLVAKTTTDLDGKFMIQTNQHGRLVLKVKSVGFEAFEKEISFNDSYNFKKAISLKGKTYEIPGAVVELPSKFKSLSGTATEISAEDIELLSPIGTQEALQFVPGITGFGDDGFGNSRLSIGIRGLNPRRSSRVLFMEDGIPIQPAVYIYPNMYYNPPVERLQEIEVIKGSGSIQYGPHTMGGVINYLTKRPRHKLGGLAKVTAGSNGYTSIYSEYGGWGNKKFFPELQVLYKRGNGYRDNNTFQQFNNTFKADWHVNDDRNIYIKANHNYEKSDATYTGITEWTYENGDLRFNPKDNDEFTVQRYAVDLITTKKITDSLKATTKFYVNHFNRDWWRENDVFIKATSLNAYLNGATPGQEIVTMNPTSNSDLVRVGNRKDNFGILRSFYVAGAEKTFSLYHKLGAKDAHLNFGARAHWERFHDEFRLGDSPTDREGNLYTETTDTAGVVTRTAISGAKSNVYYTQAFSGFFKEDISITDSFIVNFGLRMEAFEQEQINLLDGASYSDKTNFILLPGVGFNYALKSMNVFGGIHRGYTAPSSALFNIPQINQGSIGDIGLELKPEKSINYELGTRGSGKFIGYEVAGFLVDIEDMVAAARSSTFLDLGKVRTYGIETGVRVRLDSLSSWLPTLNISYTWLQTQIVSGSVQSHLNSSQYTTYTGETEDVDVSGNSLPYAPTHNLNVGLSKEITKRWTAKVDWQYVSAVYTDLENLTAEDVDNASYSTQAGTVKYLGQRGDAGPIPAYSLLGGAVQYNRESIQVSLHVKNALDQIYIASRLHSHPSRPSATGSSGILVGARRQINLTFKYNF